MLDVVAEWDTEEDVANKVRLMNEKRFSYLDR